ncbi:hypothetical protein PENARI_c017G02810 [Penicillium arizonense]|uniref:Uncharacterized protein n=1 Tax=Penicillium arizonense TaxID=1835702 RepID=A0A1F5LB23_PENAI|nr:hypothetical protein PENARI_c017G02810 [Penicillium arizonense]OGE50414.1 hypothetical protein PENARI_c017G02810 [Penicillium arizonense]
MKFASIVTVLSISSMVAAAPIIEPRNLIPGLPRPMEAVEALYPGSGVPKLASKLEKTLNLCITGYERVVFLLILSGGENLRSETAKFKFNQVPTRYQS